MRPECDPGPGRLRHGLAARIRAGLSGTDGLTLMDTVVGLTVFVILMAGILMLTTETWRTQTRAFQDNRLQLLATETLNAIAYGDPAEARGLRYACAYMTDPANSALAFRAVWSKDGVVQDKRITFYLTGDKLYQAVVDYSDPLTIVRTGGTEIASGVTLFQLTPTTTLPVEIVLNLQGRNDATFVIKTAVKPRNLPASGP